MQRLQLNATLVTKIEFIFTPFFTVYFGEEGNYFQGDIRLLPSDDPYDLYRTVFKRMAFDGSGEIDLDVDSLSARLWPDARIPYRFASHLSKCIFFVVYSTQV